MRFHPTRATASRRRRVQPRRQAPTVPPLAMLDLSKPGERQAHDFLLRTTNDRDRMWTLLSLRRVGDVLLCVVRWAYPDSAARSFSLVELSLTERAICWHYCSSAELAQAEMHHRSAMPVRNEREA